MPVSSPDALTRTRLLFEQWRATRSRRTPIPDELWQAALALCGRYSVSRLCREFHLSAGSLRARLHRQPSERQSLPHSSMRSPTFVALPAINAPSGTAGHRPAALSASLLHLQLERRDGTRLTLSVPESSWHSLESLCAALLRS